MYFTLFSSSGLIRHGDHQHLPTTGMQVSRNWKRFDKAKGKIPYNVKKALWFGATPDDERVATIGVSGAQIKKRRTPRRFLAG